MAISEARRNAINELVSRGLSPTGAKLSSRRLEAIRILGQRGIEPADIFSGEQVPTPTVPTPARIPTLSPTQEQRLQEIAPTGIARLGADITRGLASPRVLAGHPIGATIARKSLQGLVNVPIGAVQATRIPTEVPVRKLNIPAGDTALGGISEFGGAAIGSAPLIAGGEGAVASALEKFGVDEGTRILGKLAPYLKSGVAGAVAAIPQNPSHRVTSALLGGVLGMAFPGAGLALRGLFGSRAAKAATSALLSKLSGGLHENSATPITENARAIARHIRSLYSSFINEYRGRIGSVMDVAADKNITPATYSNLSKAVGEFGNRNSQEAQRLFAVSPTVRNAHDLQSVLGADIRSFKNPNRIEALQRDELIRARSALKSDMGDSLNKLDKSGNLSKAYKDSSDFYRDKVVPFSQKKSILDMAQGRLLRPLTAANHFKGLDTLEGTPEEFEPSAVSDISSNGHKAPVKLGDLLKSNLPESFRDRILYDALGGTQKIVKPSRMVTDINNLDKKGFGDFLNEDLLDSKDSIEWAIPHEKGVLPKIIKGGLVRIPQWLIAGTALRLGLHLEKPEE